MKGRITITIQALVTTQKFIETTSRAVIRTDIEMVGKERRNNASMVEVIRI